MRNLHIRFDSRPLLNSLGKLPEQVDAELGAQVRNITLDLLSQAVVRAPVKEGTLRGSGTAHFGGERIASGADFDPSAKGAKGATGGMGTDGLTGAVAFNVVYALEQHERTDFAHPKGGEAKYLERPLEENRAIYEQSLVDAAARGMRADASASRAAKMHGLSQSGRGTA